MKIANIIKSIFLIFLLISLSSCFSIPQEKSANYKCFDNEKQAVGTASIHLSNCVEISSTKKPFSFGDLLKVQKVFDYISVNNQSLSGRGVENYARTNLGLEAQTDKLKDIIETQPTGNSLNNLKSDFDPSSNVSSPTTSPGKAYHNLLTGVANSVLHGQNLELQFDQNQFPRNKFIGTIQFNAEFDPGIVTRENYTAELTLRLDKTENIEIIGIAPMGFVQYASEINSLVNEKQFNLLGQISAVNLLGQFSYNKIKRLTEEMKRSLIQQEYSVMPMSKNKVKIKYHGYRGLNGKVELPYRQFSGQIIVLCKDEPDFVEFTTKLGQEKTITDEEKNKVVRSVFKLINPLNQNFKGSYKEITNQKYNYNYSYKFSPLYKDKYGKIIPEYNYISDGIVPFDKPLATQNLSENKKSKVVDVPVKVKKKDKQPKALFEDTEFAPLKSDEYTTKKSFENNVPAANDQSISLIRDQYITDFSISKAQFIHKSSGNQMLLTGKGLAFIEKIDRVFGLNEVFNFNIDILDPNKKNSNVVNQTIEKGNATNTQLFVSYPTELDSSNVKELMLIVRLQERLTGYSYNKLLFSGIVPAGNIFGAKKLETKKPLNDLNFKEVKYEFTDASNIRISANCLVPSSKSHALSFMVDNEKIEAKKVRLLKSKPVKDYSNEVINNIYEIYIDSYGKVDKDKKPLTNLKLYIKAITNETVIDHAEIKP